MADELKVEFRVHGVYEIPLSAEVEVDGEKVMAAVHAVEVELASCHPWDGSVKLRFAGAEADMARKVFKGDEVITWCFQVPEEAAKSDDVVYEPAAPAEESK